MPTVSAAELCGHDAAGTWKRLQADIGILDMMALTRPSPCGSRRMTCWTCRVVRFGTLDWIRALYLFLVMLTLLKPVRLPGTTRFCLDGGILCLFRGRPLRIFQKQIPPIPTLI